MQTQNKNKETFIALLTYATRRVTCTRIQFDVTWLHRQSAAHVGKRRAIVGGDWEVIWLGEVGQ